ncbi:hypothetical protein [Mycobacterium sp. pW045]|uniref:hypothetical protein n=1 Tax=Mycobacterium sp. pW045 TaxID=3238984 RepID=UPI00351BBF4A
MLRLEAGDPAVRERTAAAVQASNEQGVRPTLEIRCSKCRAKLATVGTVPEFGPLFASSWAVTADSWHRVIVNGEVLGDRARSRWISEHYETLSASGKPMNEPLRHGIIALLALPPQLEQDYPPLLMRCSRHGDYIADRLEVIEELRRGADVHKVRPTGETFDYEPPAIENLRTKSVGRQAVRKPKADVMRVEEFEARLAERRRHTRGR